jgi:alpha-tubulin suppressor-like RCC1 family protein
LRRIVGCSWIDEMLGLVENTLSGWVVSSEDLFVGVATEGHLGYGNTRNLGDNPDTTPIRIPPIRSPFNVDNVNNDMNLLVCERLDAPIAFVSAGYKHTCALTTKGKIRCWGLGMSGKCNRMCDR